MEVATPTVASISDTPSEPTDTSEVLKTSGRSSTTGWPCCLSLHVTSSPEFIQATSSQQSCSAQSSSYSSPLTLLAGTMLGLVRLPRNARTPVVGKTPRPDTNVDRCSWPTQSRLFYVRDTNSHTLSCWLKWVSSLSLPLTVAVHQTNWHSWQWMTLPSAHMENSHSPSISGYTDQCLGIFIVANVQRPILGADFLRHFIDMN